jgi:hypothetical protein
MIRRRPGLKHAVGSKNGGGGDNKGNKALTTMYDFKRKKGQVFCLYQNRLSWFSKLHFISYIVCTAPDDRWMWNDEL